MAGERRAQGSPRQNEYNACSPYSEKQYSTSTDLTSRTLWLNWQVCKETMTGKVEHTRANVWDVGVAFLRGKSLKEIWYGLTFILKKLCAEVRLEWVIVGRWLETVWCIKIAATDIKKLGQIQGCERVKWRVKEKKDPKVVCGFICYCSFFLIIVGFQLCMMRTQASCVVWTRYTFYSD